jgi:hypothetical protein
MHRYSGTSPAWLAVHGTIRQRVLVNALVDPAEAAARLPDGVRPQELDGATVVGCCLLEIHRIRPALTPSAVGVTLRACAHRIAARWDQGCGPAHGVYVPMRHTSSRLAAIAGGRWFPGVHERAALTAAPAIGGRVDWTMAPHDESTGLAVRLAGEFDAARPAGLACGADRSCVDATLGISARRNGTLEVARMETDHRLVRPVAITEWQSDFLSSFRTALAPTAVLMEEVEVAWTAAGRLQPPGGSV